MYLTDLAIVRLHQNELEEGCRLASDAADALAAAGYATATDRLRGFRGLVEPWKDHPDVSWTNGRLPAEEVGDVRQVHRRRLRAVFFDVGETLVDESTEYGTWADWLGVPRHTFSAMFGAVVARGQDYRQVFEHFRPGFDLKRERQRRLEAGLGEHFNGRDLYPDARACLEELRERGYFVGIAGNQTLRAGGLIRELRLPADLIATSDDWGVEKPSPAFFEKLVSATEFEAHEIAYVGDRLENDILPAREVGLVTVLIRRGPWAFINASHPDAEKVDLRVDSLAELPRSLEGLYPAQ